MIQRGDVFAVDLGDAAGSTPAKRRPVVVVSADRYNRSRLATVLVAAITSNTRLALMPGNVFLPAGASGLRRDSVVNVTALVTLDKADLAEQTGSVPPVLLEQVSRGLRTVFGL